MQVDIRLLGGFELALDGMPLPAATWRRRQAAAVVKLLALQPAHRMHREALLDALWPDLLVETSVPRLHKAAHYARQTVGVPETLVLSGETVSLLPGHQVAVDAEVFEVAAEAATTEGAASEDAQTRVRLAEAALERYGGELLPEDRYEPWTEQPRDRLRLRHLALLRQAERWEDLAAADPGDEEAHLRVVHALATAGDRRGALRRWEVMARVLSDELGVPPSDTAQSLRRAVEALPVEAPPVEVAEQQPTFAAPASGSPRSSELPSALQEIIGRDLDVVEALGSLEHTRVLTFLGPGGIGKTTLAVEVARRRAGARKVDARFVDLTKVDDATLVPGLVATELGLHQGQGAAPERLLEEGLRGRDLVLVLDNFEHVLDAAGVVSRLVGWSGGVEVLATSRARLHIADEQVFDVAPLRVADDDTAAGAGDAVTLFEQVARTVDPAFDLDTHRVDVVEICRALDGLPLAIRLAAGHVRTLPPTLLRHRLAARLGSRTGAPRDSPERQRTIPATVDWSLQLLSDVDRRLFARLGVFAGPVGLQTVENVCHDGEVDVLDSLETLVEHSLVRRLPGPRGEPRFGMLELVREHARVLLADADEPEMRRRHAHYVAEKLESIERRRWSEVADRWIDLITDALAEIRAAHAWAVEHEEHLLATRITGAMGAFWHREGYHVEGRRWTEQALSHLSELDDATAMRVLLAAGFVAWAGDARGARPHWQAAADRARRLGDDRYLAYSLALLSGTYVGQPDDYLEGRAICDRSIALAREVGDRPLIAQALNILGEMARVHGDDDLALQAYSEGRDVAAAAHDRTHITYFLANLGYLASHREDYVEARRLSSEALRMCWSLGRRMMTAWTVSELAGPELGLGRPERAAILVGAAEQALGMLGVQRHPGDVVEHERVVEQLRERLGETAYQRLLAQGAKLSLAEAVALALSEVETPAVPT